MSPGPRPPLVPEGIDHLLLLVSGMSKAVSFYCDVLGCCIESELHEYGMVQLRVGGALIDLVDVDQREGQWARPVVAGGRNMDHVCIAMANYDERELREHLAAHDVTIIEEGVHRGARGDSLSIYVADPSGNTIELKGPPPAPR
jgi:glyoxylase I family protein